MTRSAGTYNLCRHLARLVVLITLSSRRQLSRDLVAPGAPKVISGGPDRRGSGPSPGVTLAFRRRSATLAGTPARRCRAPGKGKIDDEWNVDPCPPGADQRPGVRRPMHLGEPRTPRLGVRPSGDQLARERRRGGPGGPTRCRCARWYRCSARTHRERNSDAAERRGRTAPHPAAVCSTAAGGSGEGSRYDCPGHGRPHPF